jgi:hypothetical protein
MTKKLAGQDGPAIFFPLLVNYVGEPGGVKRL